MPRARRGPNSSLGGKTTAMEGGKAADIRHGYTMRAEGAPSPVRDSMPRLVSPSQCWVRAAMLFRVLAVGSIVLLVSACLGIAMFLTLAPGGWTIAKAAMMASCLGAAPWVGFCAANGLIGFVLRLPRPAV